MTMSLSRRLLLTGMTALSSAACANIKLGGKVGGSVLNLNTLTLSATTAPDTVTPGTFLANIIGLTSGSTLVLTSPTDGRFAISGTTLVAGSTAQTDTTTSLVFTETKAGYANSPHVTTIPFTVYSTAAPPNVSPGALWNGAAATGYNGTLPPTFTRTTAQPAVQWWTKLNSRFGDGTNLVVGIDAEALIGIQKVDFYVEGTVQTVSAPSLFVDTSPFDGTSRTRYGWWITINNAACIARTANATGALDLYAVATPNDATMQARRMGPLRVYSALKQYDWVTTVNSGQAQQTTTQPYNYQTIMAALDAGNVALTGGTAECCDIQYTQSGTFEGGVPAGFGGGHAGKGLSRIWVNSANTARIVRYNSGSSFGTGFDPTRGRTGPTTTLENAKNDPWQWVIPISNIELVGSNLIIDMHNFFSISNWTSRNDVISVACHITNSSGTSVTSYWNGAFILGAEFQALGQGSLFNTYGESALVEFVTAAASAGFIGVDMQCNFDTCLSTPNGNPTFVSGGTYKNATLANEKYFRDYGSGPTATTPILTVTYSGSAVTAWVVATMPNGIMSLFTGDAGRANPVLVHTYTFAGSNGGGGNPQSRGRQLTEGDANGWDFMTSVVADIHSGRFANWDATYVDTLNRGFNTLALNGQDFSGTFDAKASTPIPCFLDIHSEFIHYEAGSVFNNSLVRNKKIWNCGFGSFFINQENRPLLQDAYIVNMAYDGQGTSTTPSSWAGSGCVLMGCDWDEGVQIQSGNSDAYTAIANFIGNRIYATGAIDITCTNCVAGAGPAGTILLPDTTYATYAAQFNGSATGDFTIKAGSVTALNKVARLAGNLYDLTNRPFAATDYAGSVAA
jgi:hypothetical protein